ncbi:beta-ketoacyl synthase N-terminal-like domain-containing protein [Streptomyces sp. AC512_CC834]|uniref:beta-ketoacyl synthase N-terminal-like domain-containing protein n=1 Tax=Streptomyces sp. AC512_CC834 TaxID=2823691 RepID=UPI001C2781FD|nr:beta-ketoacyl synthase N-terminal-like domain-containing protein [Streptomyces sp. AC512_CC834]
MSTATARAASLPPDTPVITGWSAVSPYGIGRDRFAAGVRGGAKTAVKADASLGSLPLSDVCTVPGFDIQEALGPRGTAKMDRLTALTLVASDGLLLDADGNRAVETDDLTGVVLGITMGSLENVTDFLRQSYTNQRPFYVDAGRIPFGSLNHAAGATAIRHDLKGPNTTVAGGRISGLLALNYARRLMGQGRATKYLVGSAEEFSAAHAWFEHTAAASGDSAELLGEGCGLFLVEHAGRAQRPPLAAVLSVETRVDIDDDPHAAVTACARRALQRAGVDAAQVWAAVPCAAPTAAGRAEHEALAALVPAAALSRVPSMELLGDTSAASASFQIGAVLAVAEANPDSRGRVALVCAVDRDGGVAAAVLRLMGEEQ